MESLTDCKDITAKPKKKLMKDNAYHIVQIKGGNAKKDGSSTLYEKEATVVLQN